MGKFIDLTGQRFGRLTVNNLDHREKIGTETRIFWNCTCDCGKQNIVVLGNSLKTGNTTSCGCYRKEIQCYNLSLHQLPDNESNFNSILSGYKTRKDFTLTTEEFRDLINGDCYYCGKSPSQIYNGHYKKKGKGYVYNGIDRIDSNIGYYISNCVSCCKTCNFAKNIMSEDEFCEWIERIYNNFVIPRKTR
jgi:hypothetical protein